MYGWIITTDHIADEDEPEGGFSNAKGISGPRTLTDAMLERLKAGEGQEFRMLDDDGEVYYEGRIIYDRPNGWVAGPADSPERGFEPLDDFGMPNAGCTAIQYRNSTGEWEAM